jgi:hypothetical protein
MRKRAAIAAMAGVMALGVSTTACGTKSATNYGASVRAILAPMVLPYWRSTQNANYGWIQNWGPPTFVTCPRVTTWTPGDYFDCGVFSNEGEIGAYEIRELPNHRFSYEPIQVD